MLLGIISIETPGTNIRNAALLCSDLTSLVDFWTSRCFGWRQIVWRMEAGHRLISKHCIMWDTGGFKRCLVELRRRPKRVQHSKISGKSCGINLAALSHVILTMNAAWICWELDIIRNFKKWSS